MSLLIVAGFGAFGALARYGVSGLVQRRWPSAFPVGTLVVNVTGAFGAGVMLGVATGRAVPDAILLAVGIGFLGGYTTFSTWMIETILAAESGGGVGRRRSVENVIIPLMAGLIAASIGFALGRWF